MCFQLDRDIVRSIHRNMLENPEWEFPKVVDTDVKAADKDR
jgi:hypothetical protein